MRRLVSAALSSFALLFFIGCDGDLPTALDVPLSSIIQLTIVGEARADGASTVTLEARIARESDDRSVTFETTRGTLIGPGSTGTKIDVTTDREGLATVTLRSSREPGEAIVAATVNSSTHQQRTVFERAHATSIELEVDNRTIKRDGTVRAALTARLSRGDAPGMVSPGTEVRFTATGGRFLGLVQGVALSTTAQTAVATLVGDTRDLAGERQVTVTVESLRDDGSSMTARITIRVVD